MFLLVILASAVITFLVVFVFHKKIAERPLAISGYKFHHSLLSIVFVVTGVILEDPNKILIAIGIGIYISHIIEEVHYNGISVSKAPFMFITKYHKE